MEKSKEYWNKEACNWLNSTGNYDVPSKVRKRIQQEYLPYLSNEGLTLNLGSGCEDMSLEGWKKDNVVVLDYSRKMLMLGKYEARLEADARNLLPLDAKALKLFAHFF